MPKKVIAKKKKRKVKKITLEQKLFSLLAYLFILFIIPLMARKKDPFVQFHAKQGLALFLSYAIIVMIAALPRIGIIAFVLLFFVIIFNVVAIVKVFFGDKWKIPFIIKLAEIF